MQSEHHSDKEEQGHQICAPQLSVNVRIAHFAGKRSYPTGITFVFAETSENGTGSQKDSPPLFSHWLMKSEPESRFENGVDMKVSRCRLNVAAV